MHFHFSGRQQPASDQRYVNEGISCPDCTATLEDEYGFCKFGLGDFMRCAGCGEIFNFWEDQEGFTSMDAIEVIREAIASWPDAAETVAEEAEARIIRPSNYEVAFRVKGDAARRDALIELADKWDAATAAVVVLSVCMRVGPQAALDFVEDLKRRDVS